MDHLTLKGYQKAVNEWISQFEEGYFPPFEILAQMTEELGEISRELAHVYGKKKKKKPDENKLEHELGDLLFAIVCMANSHGLDLEKVVKAQLKKIATRDDKRFTKIDQTNP